MLFKETRIKGVYIIELEPRTDDRGFFVRNFCKKELAGVGIDFDLVQINRSFTKKAGTIRGLHFQKFPRQEGKIFQCLRGAVFSVAIDLREDSKTYGEWVSEELTEENKKMLLIPKGFASGIQTLADNCEIQYFVSEYYSGEYESGICFDDSAFNIKWPVKNPTLSEKDKSWPPFNKKPNGN